MKFDKSPRYNESIPHSSDKDKLRDCIQSRIPSDWDGCAEGWSIEVTETEVIIKANWKDTLDKLREILLRSLIVGDCAKKFVQLGCEVLDF